jgi:hypothetical protein
MRRRGSERKTQRKTPPPRPQDWLQPTWPGLGEEVEEGGSEMDDAMGRAWLRETRMNEKGISVNSMFS